MSCCVWGVLPDIENTSLGKRKFVDLVFVCTIRHSLLTLFVGVIDRLSVILALAGRLSYYFSFEYKSPKTAKKLLFIYLLLYKSIKDAQSTKMAIIQFADNTGPDQPGHKRSMIRAFIVRLQNQWTRWYMSTNRKCPDETVQMRKLIWPYVVRKIRPFSCVAHHLIITQLEFSCQI